MKKGSGKPNPPKERAGSSKKTAAARSASKTAKTTSKAPAKKATSKATAKKDTAKKATRKPRKQPVQYETEAASPKEAYLRRLANLFVTAARPEVIAARALEDGTMVVKYDLDGYELAISVADVRLVEGSIEEAEERRKGLRGRYNRIKNPEAFTIEELKERHLPLYWNEQWLRQELDRLGSYAEIARTHGYPSATTIASYAKRKFGISLQQDFDEKRQAVLEDFETGDYTQLQLANKHGVGVATVYRWLSERKPKSARRGARTLTPEERQEKARKEAAAKAAAAS